MLEEIINTPQETPAVKSDISTGPRRSDRRVNRSAFINPGERRRSGGAGANNRKPFANKRGRERDSRKPKVDEFAEFDSSVLQVRRITRVVKGGKRMRFSALVVLGDRKGKVGFGLAKGLDFQDAVAKATKKAKEALIKVDFNEAGSLIYPTQIKYKSSEIFLKPASVGTGLIAGGFIRSVLELAGVQNAYSKIIGSRNKITGVRAVFKALENYTK